MKLAEALAERSDLERRLQAVKTRMTNSARHLQDEEATEDANVLLEQAFELAQRITELIVTVNHLNITTRLDDGRDLTTAIAERDLIARQQKLLSELADAATTSQDRYGYSRTRATELKEVAAVPVVDLRRQADVLGREFRTLDTLIQQANWNTEMPEV
jgi:hypothetical protein